MRRKNQVELNLGTGVTGEARSSAAQEIETGAAKACLERPAAGGPSMEAIVERNNLRKALEQVRRNKGAPGVDGIRADAADRAASDRPPAPIARVSAEMAPTLRVSMRSVMSASDQAAARVFAAAALHPSN